MPSPAATLATALTERGITTAEMFAERFGTHPASLVATAALALVRRVEGRERADYARALDALRTRLERGLAVLADRPTPAMQARWLRLAFLSVWCIARLAEVSPDRGAAWCETDTGRRFATLQWPNFSPDVVQAVESQRLPGWSQARAPPSPIGDMT